MKRLANALRSIDAYTPAWTPPSESLPGTVVVIDPAGGGAGAADQRPFDDLAVMTGAVLFHFVQQSGGIPVMTRADDRPKIVTKQSRDGEGADSARAVRPAVAQGDMVVRIEYAPSSAAAESMPVATVHPSTNDARAQALATALAAAFESKATTKPASPPTATDSPTDVCGASVVLAAPEKEAEHARLVPRDAAERICRGLIAFVRSHGDALAARVAAKESQRTPTPVPRFVDRTPDQEMLETARRMWPHGALPIEYAAWFCDLFARSVLSDHTFVYFRPSVSVDGGLARVGGATNVALLQNTLADALRAVGVENVANEMRVLPENGALGDDRFGVCSVSMALTYAEPTESAGLRSQLLEGEPVYLLDRDAGFVLVHGDDGYWGWVRESCIRVETSRTARPRASSNRAGLLPDGSDPAAARVAAALDLLHVPYVYGGVSPIGLDCSGLVQQIFGRTGMPLARDAAQQFVAGELVATRWHREQIQAGDLLFFINACGRIFHVGIAISPTHFVHSGPPEVKIDSLQAGDRLYSEERARTFLAARRLT